MLLAIVFFPITITVLVFRSRMATTAKWVIAAVIWLPLLIFGGASLLNVDSVSQPSSSGSVIEEVREETTRGSAETETSSKTVPAANRETVGTIRSESTTEEDIIIKFESETTTAEVAAKEKSTGSVAETEKPIERIVPTEAQTTKIHETKAETTKAPETEAPETKAPETEAAKQDIIHEYVVNENTRKFHDPGCRSVKQIKEKNRRDYTGTREHLIEQGYDPCSICNP